MAGDRCQAGHPVPNPVPPLRRSGSVTGDSFDDVPARRLIMASIDKRPDGSWRARWREYAGGPQKTKHFARKTDAQRFLLETEHRLLSGTYTPPSAGQMTIAAYAEEWLARRSWAPSTHERVRRELRRYIVPALG